MPIADIETIVVVILENRSFDHLLGYLSTAAADPPMAVEGLRDDAAWLARFENWCQGIVYPIRALEPQVQAIEDPPHDHATIALQIGTTTHGGEPQMGGFVESYMWRKPLPADPGLVMGYYDKAAVPVFDFFARNFAVCDHWFAALPTGTQPNRLMAMSGESSIVDNAAVFIKNQRLVYDWLSERGVAWCAYQWGDFLPFFALMPAWQPEIVASLALSGVDKRGRFRRYARFRQHWMAPDPMPQVIFIEPEYTDGPNRVPNDDHPPTGVAGGQALLADVYDTLIANPARWSRTLMIVTYDEHGGFFDHVPPLAMPAEIGGVRFATTGVRVPAFAISPHVAPGTVFSDNLDHTSLLQLLADRFTPGKDYSTAVGARQARLGRLADLLPALPGTVRAPPAPPLVAALGEAPAAATPKRTPLEVTPLAPANVQAFHNAAIKMAREHPELLATETWSALASYVDAASTATARTVP